MPTTPILQFGTSRFLQAHADLFVSEAMDRGQALGPITVVQTSGSADRAHRVRALAAQGGFPVRIRGVQSGTLIDEERNVRSVARALSTRTDLNEVQRIMVEEAQIILSNTSDAGFRPTSADNGPVFDQAMSFPAKLTHLLFARFRAGGNPIQVMPAELVTRNGDVLRGLVREIAAPLSNEFDAWIDSNVTFVNSLVDRIVSEPIDPAGAVAEPYALWAIEDCPGLVLPCKHPDMQVVPALEPIETRKLFLLNLGHTYLVAGWLSRGKSGAVFVRDLMDDAAIRADLESLYDQEVIPAFVSAGQGNEARAYVQDVLDRFANPFLDHKLDDIAQNHTEKLQRRVEAFCDWANGLGANEPMPRLRAIVKAQA
ncbi:D-mannonate oxidoreductase [Actibacterium mucosum KCTC 23349]|uniref:D-mannonate oxidoreductase n=1 Tax=Actibacterium mucosum KCTC 23349 TaxID=1454373 RepID=A0A037ZHQ5_9RHOB|nr:D-mannonate oxidoreductase [Actibacterium mucosum]KAJ55668.1 D-mannonate oxidoreductase [Actibacterium mucosum KCTC 23349]